MLKLISKQYFKQDILHNEEQEESNSEGFTSEVYLKGPSFYLMAIKDPSHCLACDIFLEVEEGGLEYENNKIICHFSKISDERLNAFINEDETLLGIILIQFHMKIMEQLLIFCANHYASTLIIYTDDSQAEEWGIYHDFLAQKDQIISENGEQTEMVITSDQETFDEWIDFMEEVNLKFRQTLWSGQRINPSIRKYLRFHPLG